MVQKRFSSKLSISADEGGSSAGESIGIGIDEHEVQEMEPLDFPKPWVRVYSTTILALAQLILSLLLSSSRTMYSYILFFSPKTNAFVSYFHRTHILLPYTGVLFD